MNARIRAELLPPEFTDEALADLNAVLRSAPVQQYPQRAYLVGLVQMWVFATTGGLLDRPQLEEAAQCTSILDARILAERMAAAIRRKKRHAARSKGGGL